MSVAPETSTAEKNQASVENTQADLYAQANIYLAKQTKPVIIPSFAKWFDMNGIHQIEKNSLPDFFSSQSNSKYKNAEIYKNVRDFIINAYRLNPIEYLTLTAIRRNIAMDVGSLMRIYGFLSKWGLINYQIDPKTKSFTMGPQFTGHFQITLDKPNGFALQMNERAVSAEGDNGSADGDNVSTHNVNDVNGEGKSVVTAVMNEDEPATKKQKISNSVTPDVKLNLQLRKNVYDSASDAFVLQDTNNNSNNAKQVKRVYCSITGNDITETKYHNLKNKSNISQECFENSQFEDFFKSTDYVKLDKTVLNNTNKPWSNNEVLLLLEGIEMFGDDWNSISGHVGSRPKDQCISKFIQLPIEDAYLFKHISKSSYVEYLKKLKENKTIDLSSILEKLATGNNLSITSTTTTSTTTTLDLHNDNSNNNKIDATNIQKHAQSEIANQDKIISSILKLSLCKFELKLQGFMNLESRISEQEKFIESEKENLILDKMKVKKQCVRVRQELQKASEIIQSVQSMDPITPENIDSVVVEALAHLDRVVAEIKYDPTVTTNVSSLNAAALENNKTAEVSTETQKVEEFEKPISIVEPKLYTMWSA